MDILIVTTEYFGPKEKNVKLSQQEFVASSELQWASCFGEDCYFDALV